MSGGLLERKYQYGDVVEFDFEPNSIDVSWRNVTLVGVISGALYEKDGIYYNIQLRDNKKGIFGYIVVPELIINRKIGDE